MDLVDADIAKANKKLGLTGRIAKRLPTWQFVSKVLTILSVIVVLAAMFVVNFTTQDIADEMRNMWMCGGVAILCFLMMRWL